MANNQNKLKEKEAKNQLREDAGLVSKKFPKVNGIVIDMTYYHNSENPLLMNRKVNFFPTSYAYFNMDCMVRGCEGGGFDLSREIAKQIKAGKKSLKGEMPCKGKKNDVVADHASIVYEVNIKFSKKS